DLFYGRRLFASDFQTQVDFNTIARGFGMTAYDLATAADPYATLACALSTPGPCLIHATIDTQEKLYPMVPPGAANKDTMGGEGGTLNCAPSADTVTGQADVTVHA